MAKEVGSGSIIPFGARIVETAMAPDTLVQKGVQQPERGSQNGKPVARRSLCQNPER